MYYGVLGVHNAGFASIVGNWKAVDFLSDGDTSVGHAPNRLLAAAPGTISYVCRDSLSVAVLVDDLLYVHLLDNSKLTLGYTFDRGEEMGALKTGSFNDSCGYAYQGADWFHLHWGFPDTGSFEAGGWTLDFSDELWRRGDETRGVYSWFESFENMEPPIVGTTGRVSVASDGTEGDQGSDNSVISADGRYVAFVSGASNLVSSEGGNYDHVYLHQRLTGGTTRVSVASDGGPANGDSISPAISADGRYLAFASGATNLVSDDTNNFDDVYLHDRETGETTRVSVSSAGAEGNSWSRFPAISANGRYVAFLSRASDLVSDDSNGYDDVYLHDRVTGQTERVSLSSGGAGGNGGPAKLSGPSISADGRYVAFHSEASNLVAGDNNACEDVFVHDRLTGQTERVSLSSDGVEGDSWSTSPSISADGRYLAFISWASNLVSGDSNDTADVYLHDRVTGQTERVSLSSYGAEANSGSDHPSVSADGRYVAFSSGASNLVSGDSNGHEDIFVRHQSTGQTERVSLASDGTEGNGDSDAPSISADGRYVAFSSGASNLASGDSNGNEDIFVRDREGSLPYAISGQVRHANGLPAPGVTISAGVSLSTNTDSAGAFSFSLDIDGTFSLTPTLSDYFFWPAQRMVRVPPNAAGQNFALLARPVSITLSAGVPISPTRLIYTDTQNLTTTLDFPAGTVSETTTLILTPTLASQFADHAFTGHAFELAAYQGGELRPGLAFSVPVTVTVHYSEGDLRVVSDEEGLVLLLRTGSGWQDAADTCDPSSSYGRDLAGRVLALPICRPGVLALFGPTEQSYLPLIQR
jgi:Tol biopolymer transport system component